MQRPEVDDSLTLLTDARRAEAIVIDVLDKLATKEGVLLKVMARGQKGRRLLRSPEQSNFRRELRARPEFVLHFIPWSIKDKATTATQFRSVTGLLWFTWNSTTVRGACKQIANIIVAGLGEIVIILTYGLKECRRAQANCFVGQLFELVTRIWRTYRHGNDNFCSAALPQCSYRSAHGCAGGQSVIDQNGNSTT